MEETKKEESGKEKKVGKGRSAARDLCYIALFAAIIAVCAWISVPVGDIPVTLQTMGVCLAAAFLGLKRGTAAVAVYILLGLCGVPVFAGFTGGAAKLLMPTGGYIVGFIFTALVVGGVSDAVGERIKSAWARAGILAAAMAVGVAVCYAFGTAWFMILYNRADRSVTLAGALMMFVVPYLLPDLVKIIAASLLVSRLKKYMRKGNRQSR